MAATKKEYMEETRAQLDAFEVQIEGLMAQATHSDYDEHLTDIRIQQESAKATLADMEEVRGEAWQDLKSQLEKAITDIQNALFVITSDSEE
jgi:hypothetical protein